MIVREPHRRWQASTHAVVAMVALYWSLAANVGLFKAALQQWPWPDFPALALFLALGVVLWATHVLLLGLVGHRRVLKALVVVLSLVAGAASHFQLTYGVVMDAGMLRNVLRTDLAEARELITPALLLHLLLVAGLPTLLVCRLHLVRQAWPQALRQRLALLLLASGSLLAALWWQFQPLASWMRNDKTVRYLVTPSNALWSGAQVLLADARGAAKPRQAIGLDAQAGPSWAQRQRPLLVVMVVGETARAANWGLSGYERDTTPQLALLQAKGLQNFPRVQSCGTNTEVSVPCMFAPVGRRHYDEARIRGQESLLHVLARAGTQVHWLDNQSGCKGVCDGLSAHTITRSQAPGSCDGDRCLDEALLQGLQLRLVQAQGTQLLVLHMMGNHGPGYDRRYPAHFEHFKPACHQPELQRCSADELRNAYDNAVRYTDHVLARAIELLAASTRVDTALLYASDHGESLGEQGLYLHGMPYALAPRVQTEVPMVWWHSPGFERAAGLQPGCVQATLKAAAQRELAHDHPFHTLLGALDVRTQLLEPALNLLEPCRLAVSAKP